MLKRAMTSCLAVATFVGLTVDARSVKVTNDCAETITLSLTWQDDASGEWVTGGGWVIRPNETERLERSGRRIDARSRNVYYYATSDTYTWSGDDSDPDDRTYSVNGQLKRFKWFRESSGAIDFGLRCSKHRMADLLKQRGERVTCRSPTGGELRNCADGLLSYEQKALPFDEERGYCGPVAVGNVAANLCGDVRVTPHLVDAFLRPDRRVGPDGATSARDLREALNEYLTTVKACRGYRWEVEDAESDHDARLHQLARETKTFWWQRKEDRSAFPIVGLRTAGSKGHFTTVVAVIERPGTCKVIHLTWGDLFSSECDHFVGMMDGQQMVVLRDWG